MGKLGHRRRWLVGSLLVLASGVAPASEAMPERPLFRLFNSSHGLPSNTIHRLAMDSHGHLWIATLDGLARFDGVEFEVWRHDPEQADSLAQSDIQTVLVDDRDQVWLALQDGGVARYDAEGDRFESWRHDPNNANSLSTDRIWALAPDGQGGVFAGGFRGLAHIRADGRVERLHPTLRDICDDVVLSLARQDDGSLWLGTPRGLCRYRSDAGFRTQPLPPGPDGVVAGMANGLAIVDEHLWLSTSTGLRVLALPGTEAGRPLPAIPEPLARSSGSAPIVIDADGTLWYSGHNGIRRWHIERGDYGLFEARPGRALALPVPRFEDMLSDHEGSLWFASDGGGLAQLVPHWRAIRVFLPEPDSPDGLPAGRIHQISHADGKVWLAGGSASGITEIDIGTGTTRRWFADSEGERRPNRRVSAVLRDDHGRFWTGHRAAIGRYQPDDGDYRQIDRDQHGRPLPDRVRRLYQAPDGDILVAFGGGGLGRIDPQSLDLRLDPLGAASDLPCAELGDLRFDSGRGAWATCEQGVLYAAAGERRFSRLAGAPGGRVDGLDFDSQGRVWLLSEGRLLHYRRSGRSLEWLTSVGIEHGLPAARGSGVIVDGDDVVWITTLRGLFSYEPRNHRLRHYDQDDGLPSAEFSLTPPVRLGAHRFAAGTLGGLVLIDTRALLASASAPARLHWRHVRVQSANDGARLPPADGSTIRLGYDHRDLRIAVRLNSFLKPSAHRYRFWLDRHDPDWIELIGQAERVIDRLPSGRYVLQVQAIGSDGRQAGNSLRLNLIVEPPPWRQPWAYLLYALALGLLLVLAQRRYRRNLQRRHALALAEERQHWAEQASEAKTRFLASIGHEIRTPMAGLLGMNALLLDSPLDARQQHYARSIQHAGKRMLALINDLLDLSRIEAGKLSLELVPLDLAELVDSLVVESAAAAEAKGLRLGVRIETGVHCFVRADGKRLHQILLNFLSNAIKFTGSGVVRLLLSMEDGRHCFAVEDDGPGLSPNARRDLFSTYSQDTRGRSSGGSGLGLSIARELGVLMAGEVGADDRDQSGALFWLRVPLADDPGMIRGDPAVGLPPLRVVDADRRRGDDLATSLAALGARVEVVHGSDATIEPGSIVLMACDSADAAMDERRQRGLEEHHLVVALPLAEVLPPGQPRLSVLSGPWRPLATLRACRELIVPAAPVTTAARPPVAELAGLRLLLVEDDEVLREVLGTRLRALGAAVHEAGNGLQALALTDREAIDVMLLDLDLPELDGLEVLALVRQRLGAKAPSTIVITARQHPGDERQSLTAGAIAFHRKPVDFDRLVRDILATRPGYAR